MKLNRILTTVFCFFLALSVNAQAFIGGDARLSLLSSGSGSNSHSNSFVLSPMAGNFITENVATGLEVSLSLVSNGTASDKNNSTQFTINPFVRYYAIRWNKISLFGQGNVGLSYSSSTTVVGGIKTTGPKSTEIYLSIQPGLSFDATERISLETTISLFGLGADYRTIKDGTISHTSSFHAGASLDNIANTNSITIGLIYKFVKKSD